MQKYEPRQGDLTVEANFEAPAFALLRPDGMRVVEQLVTKCSTPYGVTPDNVFTDTTGSLGNRHIRINVPRVFGGLKLTISRLEVGFNDLMRIRLADVGALSTIAFETLAGEGVRFRTFTITLNHHAALPGTKAVDYLREYSGRMPENLGPVTGSAAGFYFGSKGARQHLSVVIDNSVPIVDGLYMRIVAGFDGQKISHDQLLRAGADTVRDVFSALQLDSSAVDLG